MPIVAKDTGSYDYTPAPAGLHIAVCCDVIDLGLKETQWGKKHKVSLHFQIDKRDEEGRPFIASKQYTFTLSERSNLRKDLEMWRGKDFTAEEAAAGFDLETLLGVNCQLFIKHVQGEDRIYANIESIMPPPNNQWKAMKVTPDHVRVKDRQNYQDPNEYAKQANDSQRGVKGQSSSQRAATNPTQPKKAAEPASAADHLFGANSPTHQAAPDDDLPF